MTDLELKDKDFEKAAENLAAWDLTGVAKELARVLGTVAGGPLGGALAAGTAESILRGVAKNATLRMLEEGKRVDNEREQRRLLAGYLRESLMGCFGSELKLIVEKLDTIADAQAENHLRELKFFDAGMAELRDLLLRELKPSGPSDAELIAKFKEYQAEIHCDLLLSDLLPDGYTQDCIGLSEVFVELELMDCDPSKRERDHTWPMAGRRVELRELMELDGSETLAPRWVVRGDPGAGKSTIARHLALRSAQASPDQPLAIYASLPALAIDSHGKRDPLERAEAELGQSGQGLGPGLAEALRRLGKERGRLWLLLDGWDEVSRDHRETMRNCLKSWSKHYPMVSIAVFSRRVGWEPIGSDYQQFAAVQPLDRRRQSELLVHWQIEPKRAEAILDGLSLGLKEACQLPLMATLLAYYVKRDPHAAVPRSRRQLLDRSLEVLLSCGHRRGSDGIQPHEAAQKVLGALSLRLHDLPEEGFWAKAQLTRVLNQWLNDPESSAAEHWRSQWGSPEQFLDLVSRRTGLLASRDGTKQQWQFLHRQFHELLAAQALRDYAAARAEQGDGAALVEFVKLRVVGNHGKDISRWAEVLGYACELSPRPLELLTELSKLDGDLALRVLPELEELDPAQAFEALGNANWDGDFLRKLVARWLESGKHKEVVVRWLWQQATPGRNIAQLSYIHYALESLLGEVDRERFFASCGKPLPLHEPSMVEISAGEFWMGSPENEPERPDNETRHRVAVSGFAICPTAVTNAEYEQFAPTHQRELSDGKLNEPEAANHPVVDVSWWEARLYCAWLGGRLPTEAEWECACRAGTEMPFSFGENITPEQVNYDGNHPYAGGVKGKYRKTTVAVGKLPANQWGLYELHGNVWEWCEDWYGEFSKAKAVEPKGPPEGERRVLRGGSWSSFARIARAAYRSHDEPGLRFRDCGFRFVRGRKTEGQQESGATARPGGGEGTKS